MTRPPPIADWPARDRELWNKAVEPSGLFGGGGRGSLVGCVAGLKSLAATTAWLLLACRKRAARP